MAAIFDTLKKLFKSAKGNMEDVVGTKSDNETVKELKLLLSLNHGFIPIHLSTNIGYFSRIVNDGLYHFNDEDSAGIQVHGVFFNRERERKTVCYLEEFNGDAQKQFLKAAKSAVIFRNKLSELVKQNGGHIELNRPLRCGGTIVKEIDLDEHGKARFRGYNSRNQVEKPYFVFYETPSPSECQLLIAAAESSLKVQFSEDKNLQKVDEGILPTFQLREHCSRQDMINGEFIAKTIICRRITEPGVRAFTPEQVDALKKYRDIFTEDSPAEQIYMDVLEKAMRKIENCPEQWIKDVKDELQGLAHGQIRGNNNQLKI